MKLVSYFNMVAEYVRIVVFKASTYPQLGSVPYAHKGKDLNKVGNGVYVNASQERVQVA